MMFSFKILFLCVFNAVRSANEDPKKNRIYNKINSHSKLNGNCAPLYLTPMIKSGQIEKARKLSKTGELPNAPKFLSFSGFLTVNKEYNSNMFFWFFPAANKDAHAPFLLWLQGGPGTTFFLGLFAEHGPYVVQPNMTLTIRPYHWAKTTQLLYVDSPVGAGYSYTERDKGYPTNMREVAGDLFEFLQQFFTLFHEYQQNDFYITGESYAGKYVPALAHKIHTLKHSSKMNLKGIAIGDGYTDPPLMTDYSETLFNLGLIDTQQAASMKELTHKILHDIEHKKWFNATENIDKLVYKLNYFPHVSLFTNYTGLTNVYNYLLQEEPEDISYFKKYTEHPQFSKALHLGERTIQDGLQAQTHLIEDIAKSVKSLMPVLLENYRVLIYNGQLDIIVPYVSTVKYLRSIKWKHAHQYKNAERIIWKLRSGYIAGYVHQVEGFYEVLVRNAGHLVPYDQPEVAFELITRFVNNKSFILSPF